MTVSELKNKLAALEHDGHGDLTIVCIAPEWEERTEKTIGTHLPFSFPWDVDTVDAVAQDGSVYVNIVSPESI